METKIKIAQLPAQFTKQQLNGDTLCVNTSKENCFSIVEGYGRWTVFKTVNDQATLEKHFFDEHAACQYLLSLALDSLALDSRHP